ncbi:MAG: arabinogalactan oligomer/maltooligosaccharide transport system permease protein, partial [Kiritimatiellia bacterium]
MAKAPGPGRVIATHAALFVITLVTIYPVLWVMRMALSPAQSFSTDPTLMTGAWTLSNFSDVIFTFEGATWLFGWQVFNSLVVSLATAILGLTLSTTAAYALSRWGFPGRDAGMNAFLVTQMFPGVVMAIPLYILLDELGLLDNLLGLVLVYATTSVPFSVWTLKGY